MEEISGWMKEGRSGREKEGRGRREGRGGEVDMGKRIREEEKWSWGEVGEQGWSGRRLDITPFRLSIPFLLPFLPTLFTYPYLSLSFSFSPFPSGWNKGLVRIGCMKEEETK